MGRAGYIVSSSVKFKKVDLDDIRLAWIEMDKDKDVVKESSYKNVDYFTYMDGWKPSKFSVLQTLHLLGFGTEEDDEYVYIKRFANKFGQESLFLEYVAKYLTGTMRWCDEYGEKWSTVFKSVL